MDKQPRDVIERRIIISNLMICVGHQSVFPFWIVMGYDGDSIILQRSGYKYLRSQTVNPLKISFSLLLPSIPYTHHFKYVLLQLDVQFARNSLCIQTIMITKTMLLIIVFALFTLYGTLKSTPIDDNEGIILSLTHSFQR